MSATRAAQQAGSAATPVRHDFNEVDKGGHFAACEQRQLFSQEMRAAFRTLRQRNAAK